MNTARNHVTSVNPTPRLTTGLMLLLTFATCLILANLYYAQPILAEIAGDIGLKADATGMIVTVGQFGYVVGLLFLAPLGDVLENRRLVALMAGGAGLGLLGTAFSSGVPVFMTSTFLIGFFAVATQILVVFAAGLAADSERGRVWGILACGLFLGIALSRPVSSLIAGVAGWRTVYVGAGVFMLVVGAAFLRFLPAVRPSGLRVGYGTMLRSMGGLLFSVRRMMPRVALSAGAFFSFSMFWSTAPLHLLGNLHFSHKEVALFALAGLITPPCVLLAGRLLDRGWSFRLLATATALSASAWLLTSFLSLFAMVFVMAALLIDPAGSVSTLTIQQSLFSSGMPDVRGRLNSLNVSINFCGGAIGAALGPWLFSHFGWQVVALTGTTVMLSLFTLNLFIRPTNHH